VSARPCVLEIKAYNVQQQTDHVTVGSHINSVILALATKTLLAGEAMTVLGRRHLIAVIGGGHLYQKDITSPTNEHRFIISKGKGGSRGSHSVGDGCEVRFMVSSRDREVYSRGWWNRDAN
jgi:hypothetical protein